MVNVHGTNHGILPEGKTLRQEKGIPTAHKIRTFHSANSVTIRTVPALINYYHMTMGAPPITTWIKAIDNGWFTSFPGLTSARVRQYCTNKLETAKGHMKLQRQHTQSTKPSIERSRSNKHRISTHIKELKNLVSMDLTGRYPVTSRRGYKYILIMVDWDSNYIKLIPLKSRKWTPTIGTSHMALMQNYSS